MQIENTRALEDRINQVQLNTAGIDGSARNYGAEGLTYGKNGDRVSISAEAREKQAFEMKRRTENSEALEEENSTGVRAEGMESNEPGALSMENLQRMMAEAMKRLEQARRKMQEAQSAMQSAATPEEQMAKQAELQAAQAEVEAANAAMLEVQTQMQAANKA